MHNIPPQRVLCDARVELWPVRPQDIEFLYWIAVCDQNAYRWRFRGSIPPIERFAAHIDDGVLAHFVVHSIALERPIGYVGRLRCRS